MTDYPFALKPAKYPNKYLFLILLERLTQVIGFYFSLIISSKLINNSFFGGALHIGGQLVMLFTGILGDRGRRAPRRERSKYWIYIPFAIIIITSLLVLFPIKASVNNILILLLFLFIQLTSFYLFIGTPLSPANTINRDRHHIPFFITVVAASVSYCWLQDADTGLLMTSYFVFDCLMIFLYRFLLETQTHPSIRASFSEASPHVLDGMMKVYSYKLYWLMTANTNMAFEVSMLMMVCYLPFLPFRSLWLQLVNASLFVILYCLAAVLSKLLLRRKIINELGKNSIFILFSTIWIATNIYLYRNASLLDSFQMSLSYMLLCVCIIALAFVIISMEQDMQIIGTLQMENLSDTDYGTLKALLNHWSMFFSRFVMLVVVAFLAFFTAYSPDKNLDAITLMGRYGLTLLPAGFVLIGVLAALKQPLTRLYEEKLKKYISIKSEGKSNPPLEERLKLVLIGKYSKRLGVKLLMLILKPFFLHKIIGKENVNTSKFPAVFVCNHSEIYGPVAAVLNMPFYTRPWILSDMMDTSKISGHIQQGTFDRQKWLPKSLRNRAGRLVGPAIAYLMRSMEPIPVYRNDGREILKGISMSVEALEADDNILLFPENPLITNGYVKEGIGEFFSGFVNIARDYFKKTGKYIEFYAVFANKKKRTLSFSKGIGFDPCHLFHEEKKRITDYLYEEMKRLSNS